MFLTQSTETIIRSISVTVVMVVRAQSERV